MAQPLTFLFTPCFKHGVQPLHWKLLISDIVTIHKRSSCSVLRNYRPVSLPSIMAKVMETAVNHQLTLFCFFDEFP